MAGRGNFVEVLTEHERRRIQVASPLRQVRDTLRERWTVSLCGGILLPGVDCERAGGRCG